MDLSQEQCAIVAQIVALTGASLSVGFVMWALRSERAWRQEEVQADRRREVDEFGDLKKLFDSEPPLQPKSWPISYCPFCCRVRFMNSSPFIAACNRSDHTSPEQLVAHRLPPIPASEGSCGFYLPASSSSQTS